MMSVNDYLTTTIVKTDEWVKSFCSAESAKELADLIMKRILEPESNGPISAFQGSDRDRWEETPAQIIFDLLAEGFADFDRANEALAIIMGKVLKKEIKPDPKVLSDIFYLIEKLTVVAAGDDLWAWIKEQKSYINSDDSVQRHLYLDALNAFAYAQDDGAKEIEEFWKKLWEQSNTFWWNIAFLGIRYSNMDKAIELLPELISRKCSYTPFLLHTIWRVQNDNRMADAFKKGIREEAIWAGIAINTLASKMKWAEKYKLILRLFDKVEPTIITSTEEEHHNEILGL